MSSISSTDGGYSYYQKNISDLEDDMTAENKRIRKNNEERASELEDSYKKDIKKHDAASERAVNHIRDKNRELLVADKDQNRTELERSKQETYDKYGRANKELDFERKRALAGVEEAKQNYETAKKQDDAHHEAEATRGQELNARKLYSTIETDRKSHAQETNDLRDKLNDMIEDTRVKDNQRARSNTVMRDKLEREMNLHDKALQQSHEDEMNKVKSDSDLMEGRFASKNGQNIRDRDAYFAGVIREENEMNSQRQHDDQSAYQRALDEQHVLMKKQNANNEFQLQRLHEKEDLARSHALDKQAEIDRNDLARQKADYEFEIQRLSDQIHDRDLRGADGKGPASLEQKIYGNLTDKYEKTSQEQIARDARRTDHLYKNYTEQLQNMRQEHQNQLTQTNRTNAADRTAENQVFVDHSFEMQQANKMALESKDQDTERQGETIRRTYGNMIDRQRRDYENILQQNRDDSSTKFKAYRQDADFNSKMAQRSFTTQQNETIRSYEKKLGEQKNLYEDQIDTLKNQLTQVTHEGERRTQRALDDQQRGYEQKIAQMEYQNKERERILSQNYEDQIDKIKRANALLIQKKS